MAVCRSALQANRLILQHLGIESGEAELQPMQGLVRTDPELRKGSLPPSRLQAAGVFPLYRFALYMLEEMNVVLLRLSLKNVMQVENPVMRPKG